MKSIIVFVCVAVTLASCGTAQTTSGEQTTTATASMTTDVAQTNNMDSISYSLGVLVAQNLKSQGLDKVKPEDVARGISDVITGKETQISVSEANQMLQAYMMQRKEQAGQAAVQRGKDFLEKNKQRPEVKTTDSGLQYEVLQEGTGASPKASDNVTVHYRGTLLDGKEFDSSYARNSPASFPLNGVIRGWTEGLQLMKTGAKYRFYIPSELAYGSQGAGADIGPNETLIFDVELLSIK